MDLVKNLLKSHLFYTLPSDVRCSTDVRSFLIARTSEHFRTSDTSTTETFLRMSGILRTSDTFTSEAFLRMSGPARTSVSCTLDCGSHFSQWPVVRWLSDVRTHLGLRTSDVLRTPGHPVPQTVTSSHHLYIYTFPFHGIRLTIHLEPIKNTPHSLSHSSTLNPRFPSVLGAFERSSQFK